MTIVAGSPDSWATQNFDYDCDMPPTHPAADNSGAAQYGNAREKILVSETSDGNKRLRDNWYHPAALALAPVSVSKEDSPNAVCLDSIKDAGACNKGVFFDVVNSSNDPIFITQIEAGAFGVYGYGTRKTSLFVCEKGACKGNESESSSWRVVWKGTLTTRTASSCVLNPQVKLAPGKVQGF